MTPEQQAVIDAAKEWVVAERHRMTNLGGVNLTAAGKCVATIADLFAAVDRLTATEEAT